MSFFFSSRRRHTRLQGDWSSDVCSSDLLVQTVLIQDLSLHQAQNRIAELEKQLADASSKPTSFLGGLFGGGSSQPSQPATSEIGRASCRGRGEISVGAGSLKKKKDNNNV